MQYKMFIHFFIVHVLCGYVIALGHEQINGQGQDVLPFLPILPLGFKTLAKILAIIFVLLRKHVNPTHIR